jgi:hypothetical protein
MRKTQPAILKQTGSVLYWYAMVVTKTGAGLCNRVLPAVHMIIVLLYLIILSDFLGDVIANN